MMVNYFLGAVILMLTSDISNSAEPCLCPAPLYSYSTDCCREPIWKVRTTPKILWDMWWTRKPIWDAWMTTQMPIWKRSTTWRYFGDMWTTRKQSTKPTTFSPFDTRTGRTLWDWWGTRKPITTPTAPLYHSFWSTTPSSSPKDVAIIIGASVGSVTCLGILCCFIAACVRMKRVQRRPVQAQQTHPDPQRHSGTTRLPCILIRRILVRQCGGSSDTENLISNPQVNSDIAQSRSYEYNPGPITPVAPPPYSPSSPYEPPPPYSEHI
ncbi:hypothetical protein ACJMK2_015972 [Sinanodonta woodiana]|uniref:Uncharacterized protein n=1 Tax=Sinanodonta woodiana TaxID=1069815 RepID=A0ABD3UTB7_SINWO